MTEDADREFEELLGKCGAPMRPKRLAEVKKQMEGLMRECEGREDSADFRQRNGEQGTGRNRNTLKREQRTGRRRPAERWAVKNGSRNFKL